VLFFYLFVLDVLTIPEKAVHFDENTLFFYQIDIIIFFIIKYIICLCRTESNELNYFPYNR